MADIRVDCGLPQHIKMQKLGRRLGDGACYKLIVLWAYTALNHPDGCLGGLDDEDIALASQWTGEPATWVRALVELGWLDGEPGSYRIHDWAAHQPYVSRAPDRREQAKKAAATRWSQRHPIVPKASSQDARSMPGACGQHGSSNAPDPVPVPDPDPSPDPLSLTGDPRQPAAPAAAASRVRRQPITLDRETWRFDGITDDDGARWSEMAPHVAIDLKLRALEEWCRANPRRAPRSRVQGWITGILVRDEEKARRADRGQPSGDTRGADPAEGAWAEVCQALEDYTGAPGDDDAFANRVSSRHLAAVRAVGGASAVARALNGTVTERTQVQRQFATAWRSIDA